MLSISRHCAECCSIVLIGSLGHGRKIVFHKAPPKVFQNMYFKILSQKEFQIVSGRVCMRGHDARARSSAPSSARIIARAY